MTVINLRWGQAYDKQNTKKISRELSPTQTEKEQQTPYHQWNTTKANEKVENH